MRLFFSFVFLFAWLSHGAVASTHKGGNSCAGKNSETQLFYRNLKRIARESVMFGMANPTTISYKGGPKNDNIYQSDCKSITGAHPAFHESDFMWYRDPGGEAFMKTDLKALKKARDRGALIGYCWHLRGRQSNEFYSRKDGQFTDDRYLIKKIVNGSKKRSENPSLDWLLSLLDDLAIPVFREIETPVLFRPFHEMNGDWFWWGSTNCTPGEYQELYRLVVDYLRSKGVRNVLYVWSPDTKAAFEYYPGDEYVDIVGMDIYEPGIASGKSPDKVISLLQAISRFAEERNKIAALTETGLRKKGDIFRYPASHPQFWTKNILNIITNDTATRRIAYVMSWYSADWHNDKTGQFYIPYPGIDKDHPNGQKAIDDFLEFYNDPFTLFEDDLPDLYDNLVE